MASQRPTDFDQAVAAQLRRLAELLAGDQAALASAHSLPGDIDLAAGKAAVAEALAATADLTNALGPGVKRIV